MSGEWASGAGRAVVNSVFRIPHCELPFMRGAGQPSLAHHAAQVGVARPVGRQQHALPGAVDDFGADDGLDAGPARRLVEEHCPVESVRVGQGHG